MTVVVLVSHLYYIPNMTFFFCFTSESFPDIEYLNLCILQTYS